jgi:hypothetical protein
LTFALNTGNVSGASFTNPNTSTSYITTNSLVSFTGTDSITLVDLTNGGLTLRQNSPYLLIQSTGGFSGLVTEDSTGHLSLDVNGYVLGIWDGGGEPLTDYTTITFSQFGSDGVTPLSSAQVYPVPQLYLSGNDLEVVPEPGTWALMIGGLALLVVIQRRRNNID